MINDMKLTSLQRQLRKNIREYLRLLSSAEEQLEYQRNVPWVNITVELVCMMWHDDYILESKAFSSAFSKRELQAMAEFNQVLDAITESSLSGEEIPQIEAFINTPEWARLSQAASVALRAFKIKVNKTDGRD